MMRRLVACSAAPLLVALWLGVCASVAGCAHSLEPGAVAITVDCNVADATVYVDDLMVGHAAELKKEPHAVRPGFHRIEVRAPGYYSFFQEVDLPPNSKAVVNARLREVLD